MEKQATVNSLTLEEYATFYRHNPAPLDWNLVFSLPAWLSVWWKYFGRGWELLIRSVQQDGRTIGLAPLMVKGDTAAFIGNVDVCDYQDFIVKPGLEEDFFKVILSDLKAQGIRRMSLETVRPDSTVVRYLVPMAQSAGLSAEVKPGDVSSVMELPLSWENYLAGLDSKQRHEIKRKMRNLNNLGEVRYHRVEKGPEVVQSIETFLRLFPESRGDKALFMTGEMQSYFRDLTRSLSEIGVVRMGCLDFDGRTVAMVMYFDYNEGVYLYNSAYDPEYRALSVGIISKVSCIRDSIEAKKKIYDFLKGPEIYKTYLGGKTLPLFSCTITLE